MPPHLSEKVVFIEAEGIQESGGNYGIVNQGSGALGKYQVMPSNLAPWLRECGLKVVSPGEYLRDATLQDELAYCKLGGYYDTYGPRGAASVWYSGQPNWHATYGDPPVYKYVASVLAIMNRISGGSINIPSPVYSTLPAAREPNWSGHIHTTKQGIDKHFRDMHAYNRLTWHMLYRRNLPR